MKAEDVASSLAPWGRCRPVSRLEGGHRNVVFRVERDGEHFVAKSTRRTPEAVAWLVEVQRKARDAGFEVPRFVPSRRGRIVENGLTLEAWIGGQPTSRGQRGEALPLLRTFHASTRGWNQRPGCASSAELIRSGKGGDVNLAAMPPDLASLCRAAWSALAAEPVSAIHGDLNSENVLLTPSGRFALIDWDEARVDAAILDEVALSGFRLGADPASTREANAFAAVTAWEVATSWRIEPRYAKREAQRLRRHLPE